MPLVMAVPASVREVGRQEGILNMIHKQMTLLNILGRKIGSGKAGKKALRAVNSAEGPCLPTQLHCKQGPCG